MRVRTKRRVRRVAWAVLALVLGGALAIIAVTVSAGLRIRDELERAIPLATEIQRDLVLGDLDAVRAGAERFDAHTSAAVRVTREPVWRLVSLLPVVGPNLEAMTTIARVADDISSSVVRPAADIPIDAFRPVAGHLDIDALTETAPVVGDAHAALEGAAEALDEVPTDELIAPVAAAVSQLRSEVDRVSEITRGLTLAATTLPQAAGAAGDRDYLLVFPNTAEPTSLGGTLTAAAVLRVSAGDLTIIPQIGAATAVPPVESPIVPFTSAEADLYGDDVGRAFTTATRVPDFRVAAEIVAALWTRASGVPIDGVISIDPVALGYLLEATGPVQLDGGGQLDSGNTADLLLSQVYEDYPTGEQQDAYFAAVSGLVAAAVTSGRGTFPGLVAALAHAAEEHRLLVWAADESLQEVVELAGLDGALDPADGRTSVGVYLDDWSSTKLGYHLDAELLVSADRCTASDTDIRVAGSLTSSVPTEDLPPSLSSPVLEPGEVRETILVFGPVGARHAGESSDLDGATTDRFRIDDRPVVRIDVVLAPGERLEWSVEFTAEGLDHPRLDVRSTPLVRETPVRVYDANC